MKNKIYIFLLCLCSISAFAEISLSEETTIVGECSGEITVTAFGDAGPFSIYISGVDPNGNELYIHDNQYTNTYAGGSFENLCAGNYSVEVVDRYGCITTLDGVVEGVCDLEVTFEVDPHCGQNGFGLPGGPVIGNGAITAVPVNGEEPISYLWSTASTASTIDLVAPGTYMVTVTDNRGCEVIGTQVMIEDVEIDITLTSKANCDGLSDVNLSSTGGIKPLSFSWSNGANTSNLESVSPGNYTVTVTSANGCSTTASIIVESPGGFLTGVGANIINGTCLGGNDAVIEIYVNGLEPEATTFIVLNQNGQEVANSSSPIISGLTAGETYELQAINDLDCLVSTSYYLPPTVFPFDLEADISPYCNPENQGSIRLTGVDPYIDANTGNIVNYSIHWEKCSPCETIPGGYILNDVTPGFYRATATRNDGCRDSEWIEIIQLPNLEGEIVVAHPCNGGDGTISVDITSGNPPYTYHWNTGSNSASIQPTEPGFFAVTVTDNCNNTISKTAFGPYQLLEIVYANVNNGNTYGEIEILNVTGGDGDYFYLWSNGETTSSISNLESGTYSVTVTDGIGCTTSMSFDIENCVDAPHELALNVSGGNNSRACGDLGGKIFLSLVSGAYPLQLEVVSQSTGDVVYNETILNRISFNPDHNQRWIEGFEIDNYFVILTDECNNQLKREINLCSPCSYVFEDRSYFAFDGSLEIRYRDCSGNCGFDCNKLKVFGKLPKIAGNDYTITWPDGKKVIVYLNQNNNYKYNGPRVYEFDASDASANGTFLVNVKRTDGCEINIPVEKGDALQDGVEFIAKSSGAGNLFITDAVIHFNAFPEVDYYVQELPLGACGTYEPLSPQYLGGYLKFAPNSYDNPCNGGGTLYSYEIIGNQIRRHVYQIPGGVSIPTEMANPFPGASPVPGYECTTGGFCLFDALDIYGFTLPYNLYMPWCSTISEIPDPNLEVESNWNCNDYPERIVDRIDKVECTMYKFCELSGEVIGEPESFLIKCYSPLSNGNGYEICNVCDLPDNYRKTCGQWYPTLGSLFEIEGNVEMCPPGFTGGGPTVSDPRSTETEDLNNSKDLLVYPNPFKDFISVETAIQEPGPVTFQIFDIHGKQVLNEIRDAKVGFNIFNFEFGAEVNNGIYHLIMIDSEGVISTERIAHVSRN